MAEKNKAIIIYGGSFDPPHRGHLRLAAEALRQLKPAALYFVPGFLTPFKDFSPAPYAARAALLRTALAACGLAAGGTVKISAFEAGLRRVVYTWETVAHFRFLHPGSPLYFLMGSDCLAAFGAWKRPDFILKNVRLLAGLRPGYDMKRGGAPFIPLTGVFPEADSTAIRSELFLGRRPPQLDRAVVAEIGRRGLYLGRERERLRGLLSPRRFLHSLQTARLALELAPMAGVSRQKAALAALLHDCARDMTAAALRRYCGRLVRRDAQLRETLLKAPLLAHASAGAELARKEFGVRDPEITEAIKFHATGAPGMSPLARLLYVSDLANQGRSFPEAAPIRELAFLDLEAAFKAANYVKLTHAFAGGGWVHPLSVQLWNSLQEKQAG